MGTAAGMLGLLLVVPLGSPNTGLEDGFVAWPSVMGAWEPAEANPMLAGPPAPASHDPAAWRAAARRMAWVGATPEDRVRRRPPEGPGFWKALDCYRRARVLEQAAGAAEVADADSQGRRDALR